MTQSLGRYQAEMELPPSFVASSRCATDTKQTEGIGPWSFSHRPEQLLLPPTYMK